MLPAIWRCPREFISNSRILKICYKRTVANSIGIRIDTCVSVPVVISSGRQRARNGQRGRVRVNNIWIACITEKIIIEYGNICRILYVNSVAGYVKRSVFDDYSAMAIYGDSAID